MLRAFLTYGCSHPTMSGADFFVLSQCQVKFYFDQTLSQHQPNISKLCSLYWVQDVGFICQGHVTKVLGGHAFYYSYQSLKQD